MGSRKVAVLVAVASLFIVAASAAFGTTVTYTNRGAFDAAVAGETVLNFDGFGSFVTRTRPL